VGCGCGSAGRAKGQEIATEAIIAGCVGPEKKGCAIRADDSDPVSTW
jgi:hypothetical protein